MYTFIAKLNKFLLPCFSKKQLDLAKASKVQLAIIGWRSLITKKVINQ